jgi:sarcosine oxidase
LTRYDVAVVGLGAMGSAALFHLARRGVKAIGIEQFLPGHDRGSSHGESRAIRLGYSEHPSYVPLVRRAFDNWRELERLSGS